MERVRLITNGYSLNDALSKKILLDENIPTKVLWWLISEGYVVHTVREIGLMGRSDRFLYDFAERHEYLLISLDLDFADPIQFPPTFPRIVLRPGVTDPELIQAILADVFALKLPSQGELFVVQPEGFARYTA
jgi:predicted nuclease of predicted toxin-antitoxin system